MCVVKTGLEQIVFGPGVLSPVSRKNNAREQSYCKAASTSSQRQKGGGRQKFSVTLD